MKMGIFQLAQIAATTVVFATALTLPIVAEAHRYHHHHHHHYRSLTVTQAPVVAASDPFSGPAVIFTAPIALAAAFVSLPFRAAGELFPATANDPRIIVGAPVHFVGQAVQYPFYAVGTAFGAAPVIY
jgi:hypothetical protein